MGRAMLIIAAGAIIAVGMLQLGVQGKRASIAKNTAVDAYEVEIRNKAFTAAQITMERINESGGDWHPEVGTPWKQEIDGTPITLYYDKTVSAGTGTFAKLEDESIEIHSSATYEDPMTGQIEDINIITSYVKRAMHFVPEFQGAMQFALDSPDLGNFQIQSNASTLSGNDISGECSAKPAVVVKDQATADKINAGDVHSNLEGDAGDVVVNEDLSYQPVDELVARLSSMNSTVKINQYHPNVNSSGKWEGNLGSPEEPGVFFVEDYAKFAAQSEGWGILVVRDAAVIEGETTSGEIELRGGFTFNGLVILENAYNMDAAGTININGSVLVGTTDDYTGSPVDIDITGNAEVSYSCEGQKYAQLASAIALNQNRYKRLSTYE